MPRRGEGCKEGELRNEMMVFRPLLCTLLRLNWAIKRWVGIGGGLCQEAGGLGLWGIQELRGGKGGGGIVKKLAVGAVGEPRGQGWEGWWGISRGKRARRGKGHQEVGVRFGMPRGGWRGVSDANV